MSVRTIPKNYRNLTGLANSQKANDAFFESSLERDFLTMIEFDSCIESYDVQPICISWMDSDGRKRKYTPDALLNYIPGRSAFSNSNIVLCEIKYRSDIQKNWEDLKPKFKAAIRYAKEQGWRFKLFTENEIRTTYMENARFLQPYLRDELNESHEELIFGALHSMRECSVEQLIKSLFNDKWAQAEILPSLWWLIAAKRVNLDLNLPITMSSRIWIGR